MNSHRLLRGALAALSLIAGGCAIDGVIVPVPSPTLTAIGTAVGVEGTSVTLALTGTHFVARGTLVIVSGGGVAAGGVTVENAESATVSVTIAANATLGTHQVTVVTPGGISGAIAFVVNPPPPTLTAVAPAIGITGASTNVTLTGTNFVPGAAVSVSGTGVAVTNIVVASATSISASFVIDANATLGARTVTVTTSGGSVTGQTFIVNPPTPVASGITPAIGVQGTPVAVTITGTNFISGATSVSVSGTGVVVSNVVVVSGTSLTATLTIDGTATLGARAVIVTTAGGATSGVTFTVNPPVPTLTGIAPATGFTGTNVLVTLTGTNFVAGATTVGVTGIGVTISGVNVVSATSLTATFTISLAGIPGAHNVTVTTAGGSSSAQAFTVQLQAPSLVSLSKTTGARTGTQNVTLTGANFDASAAIFVSGTNVTVSNVIVTSGTTITADFAVGAGAALGARNVTVMTDGGTTGAAAFTVVVPPSITSFDALAVHLVATQPSRLRWATANASTCTIDNGVGSVTSCNDSLFVTPGTTKTYTLSATAAGATVTQTFQLFANEPGRWVYSTSSGGAVGTHVHQFSLDATTGNLTAIGAGTVGAGTSTRGIAVDPSGKFVYAANGGSGTVQMYSIDQSTGALTSFGTVAAGTEPREISVDPSGRFAYVLDAKNDAGNGDILRYTIDATTGQLTANGTNTIANSPRGIAVDGSGRFLYATNFGSNSIQEFTINGDGSLTAVGTISGLTRAFYVTSDPAGRFLYVTNSSAPTAGVSQYSIGSTGALTLLTPLTALGGTIDGVTVDATGTFAYAIDFNNCIFHEFTLDQTTGILTRFAVPTLPHAGPCIIGPYQVALDPQGKFAYMTNQLSNTLGIFAIGGTGVLSPVTAPLTTIAGGTTPYGIVVSR